MEKKYVIAFFTTTFSLMAAVFLFVTWMNPNRTVTMPWSIDFVADRNMALKKFSLIKDNQNFTDLIVGSSTSEVLVPEMIEKLYGVKSYLGGTGGSKTALRLAQITLALNSNPNLKRVLYICDLFEFGNSELDMGTYYSKDIMSQIPEYLKSRLKGPDWVSVIQEYFSETALKNSFKTLSDYKNFKAGTYQSQYRADGTTARSMLETNSDEPIETRALRIARVYESYYKTMDKLDPAIQNLYQEVIKLARERNIEVVFVIAPYHSVFYNHFAENFKKNNDVYRTWVDYIKSLAGSNVRVVDYSYPLSIEKGISDDKEYWHDGIHFSHKSAEIILNEVYKR